MAHYPLNHHLRQTYRTLAGLAGLYLILTGIFGIAATWGDDFTNDGHDWVLGQRLNPAGSWVYAVAGLVLLAGVLLGGNLFRNLAIYLAWILFGIAVLTMTLLQTDADILNASMANIITLIIIGLVVLTAGLYGKVGSDDAARREEAIAHSPR